MTFLGHSPFMEILNSTLPCVNAPTTAGTRNPGIVAAILVIPINTPKIELFYDKREKNLSS